MRGAAQVRHHQSSGVIGTNGVIGAMLAAIHRLPDGDTIKSNAVDEELELMKAIDFEELSWFKGEA